MSEVGYSLIFEFDADGDFVRGFEAGRLWTQLEDEAEHDGLIGQPIHTSNTEMLMRMGEALGVAIAAEQVDETWIEVTAINSLPYGGVGGETGNDDT